MLVVRANAAREAARVAEAAAELAAREEAAHAVMQAEELAEEAAEEVAAQEEMARDRHRWDDDMAAARHGREVHELATQRRHRRNPAAPARPTARLEHRRPGLGRRPAVGDSRTRTAARRRRVGVG
jgi:hypothetical protein